ncbi:MAG TPA: hypothetical protein VF633_11470 [Brevundimonas sp.]|jgi:hypothetical protein
MAIRIPALVVLAALTLGAAACTQGETTEAKSDAAVAGEQVKDAAAQTGEVIESGTAKAANAVSEGAAKVADHLEADQAKDAAAGAPGAVNPHTDERVPAPAE